jgi:hypothetical protein
MSKYIKNKILFLALIIFINPVLAAEDTKEINKNKDILTLGTIRGHHKLNKMQPSEGEYWLMLDGTNEFHNALSINPRLVLNKNITKVIFRKNTGLIVIVPITKHSDIWYYIDESGGMEQRLNIKKFPQLIGLDKEKQQITTESLSGLEETIKKHPLYDIYKKYTQGATLWKNKRFHDCLNKPDLSGVDPEYVYAGIKRGYYPLDNMQPQVGEYWLIIDGEDNTQLPLASIANELFKSRNIRITKVIVKKGNGCRMITAPHCLKDTEVIYFCDARETIAKKFEIRSFPSLITLDKKSNRIEVIAVTAPNGRNWNTLFTKDK